MWVVPHSVKAGSWCGGWIICCGADWIARYDTTAAAVQRVEVGTLDRAVKLSNKDAKLTKEHLRPLQVR